MFLGLGPILRARSPDVCTGISASPTTLALDITQRRRTAGKGRIGHENRQTPRTPFLLICPHCGSPRRTYAGHSDAPSSMRGMKLGLGLAVEKSASVIAGSVANTTKETVERRRRYDARRHPYWRGVTHRMMPGVI